MIWKFNRDRIKMIYKLLHLTIKLLTKYLKMVKMLINYININQFNLNIFQLIDHQLLQIQTTSNYFNHRLYILSQLEYQIDKQVV
jgi:ATP-dependent 26S proteasome regulatory subunit